MSPPKITNQFNRNTRDRTTLDRARLNPNNLVSFTMSETNIENIQQKVSKEILLHSPAGLTLYLDNSVVPPDIYNDCHDLLFSIGLTPRQEWHFAAFYYPNKWPKIAKILYGGGPPKTFQGLIIKKMTGIQPVLPNRSCTSIHSSLPTVSRLNRINTGLPSGKPPMIFPAGSCRR